MASNSPRRREILERAGLTFTVDAANIEEDMARKVAPGELAKRLAFEKAAAVALRHPGAIIIGADTVVASGKYVWSKPENAREAAMMLKAHSGKTHAVWTGFAILDTASGKRVQRAVKTSVKMRALSPKEIATYVKTGEPFNGAGGYQLQGTGYVLVSEIKGDYNNIIGLPLTVVLKELKKLGVRA